ncbi:hypothetical protein EV193_10267 [Herbihabitans rhizosphaerae]|uniref:Uncharacterized protein n=1 Tax=Herbihabitans rhizosphaerae TaxID=1872711 RepID=A0A4Q7L3Q4_9PSEU|nr:hypothetical protein [Herbihabitans rhizosphaerae]RZS43091.1 hypothetical protein EV193_10267 [Herbihabitans rhizosphaerae]
MTDYLEFKTGEIQQIASATRGHQAQWDQIWNTVRTRLGGVVSAALDAQTGSSLEERTVEYNQKTQQYNQQLLAQQNAVRNVGDIATETNHQMTRTISGR